MSDHQFIVIAGFWEKQMRPRQEDSSNIRKIPPIHLFQQPRKTKERGIVKNYSMAISYRENGKNLKKILMGLGQLSDDRVEACRSIFRLWNQAIGGEISKTSLSALGEIELGRRRQLLDCATVVALWDMVGIQRIFPTKTREENSLSTEEIALILVANRVLAPTTKIRTVEWFSLAML